MGIAQSAVFHLYLLIGQSNMAGRGSVGSEDRQAHPRVLALDRANQWVVAVDPLHFDKPAIAGVGPGLTFGKVIAERQPDVRIGLVPCAVGGSPICSWTCGGYWQQTNSHPYDDAIARARIAQQSGTLVGALWHQGESDSNESDAEGYLDRLSDLIHRLHADLAEPSVPFVVGTLGDFFVERNPWAGIVNHALRTLPQRVPHTACVEATGLTHRGDELHFDAASARELGRRYAEAMVLLQQPG